MFDRRPTLMAAYAPYRMHVHRIVTDLSYAWLVGYRRPPFWIDWWQFVDIDAAAEKKATRHDDAGVDRALAAAASLLGALGRRRARRGAAARRSAAKVLALRLRRGRDGLRSGRISDLYSRIVTAHIVRGAVPLRLSRAAASKIVPHTADGDARGRRRLPDLDDPDPPRHLFRRRPGLQGQAARARRGRLRLFVEAVLRSGQQEPVLHGLRPRKACSASRRCATRR